MEREMSKSVNGKVKPTLKPTTKCDLLVSLREVEHNSLGIAKFCQKIE